MLHLPVLRWGEPYTSMEVDEVVHFSTGEPIARVSRANGGLIQRDARKAHLAREALRQIPVDDLIARVGRAGELYMSATLPMGDGTQSPDEFVHAQSASTGLPERMCRANMKKNAFVLTEMRNILESLTRGLSLDVLATGHGEERGVPISYQAQSPVLGLVLPSNSPGVHTLWLPIIPMQVGLVLKPGPQEPWTPYRMAAAFFEAGIPRTGDLDLPGWRGRRRRRARRLRTQPGVRGAANRRSLSRQSSRPGARPGLLEDPARRRPGRSLGGLSRLDGRERVRQQRSQLHQHVGDLGEPSHEGDRERLAQRLAAIRPLPPEHPDASLAAFTVPGVAEAISQSIDADLQAPGVDDVTATHREGSRLIKNGKSDYLLPTVIHASSPEPAIVKKEFMFPFVTVVECPESKMLDAIGSTLVCTAITCNESFKRRLLDAVHVDRLNFGRVPTTQLNWRQPHEGNIVEFLFRARAFQSATL